MCRVEIEVRVERRGTGEEERNRGIRGRGGEVGEKGR